MFPFSLLRRHNLPVRSPRRHASSGRGGTPRFHPRLEPLEDRMLMNATLDLAPPVPDLNDAAEVRSMDAEHHGAIAVGHSTITVNGELRTFSFALVQKKDGSYKGVAYLNNRADGVRAVIKIDDAAFFGDALVMSGSVVHTNKPEFADADVLFAVRDNGNGRNGTADELTLVFFFEPGTGPGPTDLGPPPEELFMPNERGNIKVFD